MSLNTAIHLKGSENIQGNYISSSSYMYIPYDLNIIDKVLIICLKHACITKKSVLKILNVFFGLLTLDEMEGTEPIPHH